MKLHLICAAGVVVVAAASFIAADVVDVQPVESYNTILETAGWQPAQKVYSLANTGFDWVYWQGANASGNVVCQPNGGWIAPGTAVNVTLSPTGAMATAEPGTYSEQVVIDTVPRLCGDVDGDDLVDVGDLLSIGDAWSSGAGDPNYRAACDFNGDGAVDAVDLLQVSENWGRTMGGTAI